MTAPGEPSKLFTSRNVDAREATLGAFAVLLGLCVGIGAIGFGGGRSDYDSLGPSLLPLLIASGLVLTGLPILIGAFAARTREAAEEIDWIPVVLLTVGLIVPIVFIRTLGWIPVVTVVFALGARAFRSRRILLDLGLGLAFGIVSFVIFNFGLGLNLPRGWLVTKLVGG